MTQYEITTLITSTLTPIAIVILGYWFNRRLKQFDIAYQRQSELNRKENEQQLAEMERRYKPHIEFTMDANFFGPQNEKYVAEFVIHAHNKSLVRHEFRKILFRVRGIKKGEGLRVWEGDPPRLYFPHKLIDSEKTDIIPKNWNYIFVEPGVRQSIDFATPIDAEYAYIVARAEFRYDKYTPHVIERVFALPAYEPNSMPTRPDKGVRHAKNYANGARKPR